MIAVGGGGSPESIYIINGIFLAIAWLMVSARCYVRHFLLQCFSKEDWLGVIALFGFTTLCAGNIMIGTYGSGSHMVDLSPQDQAGGLKWWWILENIYIPTSCLVKISCACVCLRLVDKRRHTISLNIFIGFMILYSVIFFFLNLLQCIPVEVFWTRYLGVPYEDKCLSTEFVGQLQLVYSSTNALCDITLSILACSLVYMLHLPTGGDKASVGVVLSFGVLACCAVVIRLPFLISLKNGINDFLYWTTEAVNWSCIEVGMGIVATSGSSLRPLIRTLVSRSIFIGTSIDPTSTRWKRPRDHEGYIRSGAAPRPTTAGHHSRDGSENFDKIEMFPTTPSDKTGKMSFLDLA